MQIATILPTPYLNLAQGDHYHMALAHLLGKDPTYREFFREKTKRGDLLIMDNGIVEEGNPMPMKALLQLALDVGATELVLPDCLNDPAATLFRGEEAMQCWNGGVDLIAVPQGRTTEEWLDCLGKMLYWPVKTIGISRFLCPFTGSRLHALRAAKSLIQSDKNIHLLGCTGVSSEIRDIQSEFPGRIRGIDSGVAAIYAQGGARMSEGGEKPILELNFRDAVLDKSLLIDNIYFWKRMCGMAPKEIPEMRYEA